MPEYDKLNDTYDTVQYRAQDVTDWEKTTLVRERSAINSWHHRVCTLRTKYQEVGNVTKRHTKHLN